MSVSGTHDIVDEASHLDSLVGLIHSSTIGTTHPHPATDDITISAANVVSHTQNQVPDEVLN